MRHVAAVVDGHKDCQGSGLHVADGQSLMDDPVRIQSMVLEDSRPGCKADMVRCGLLGQSVVEESNLFPGRSASHRDAQSKCVDYRTDCSSRWSRQNPLHLMRAQYTSSGNLGMETHVVSRAPSPPSFGLDV